jgi:hypothetical protein
VTLVMSANGYVFGGFTPVPWESGEGTYKPDPNRESFLFRLRNPQGDSPRVFPIEDPEKAIYCSRSKGPTFGGAKTSDHDLSITDNCNTNACSTKLGMAYRKYPGGGSDSVLSGRGSEYVVGVGWRPFQVKKIEVLAVSS